MIIKPSAVRDLELEDPNLKIRATFVGYSRKMKFLPLNLSFNQIT